MNNTLREAADNVFAAAWLLEQHKFAPNETEWDNLLRACLRYQHAKKLCENQQDEPNPTTST